MCSAGKWSPKDVHILVPRTCEHARSQGQIRGGIKGADRIKVANQLTLKEGNCHGWSGWASGITKVLKSGRGARGVRGGCDFGKGWSDVI